MGIDAELLVKTRRIHSADEVRKLAYRLGEAFGAKHFLIHRSQGKKNPAWHCLEIIDRYRQDGPTIYPEEGEQLLRANIATRFYGEDYERGDLPFILSVAAWLEACIEGARVYYGGDSSGARARRLDAEYREELWAHFCAVGHMPYANFFDVGLEGLEGAAQKKRPVCDLCKVPLWRSGWGKRYGRYYCAGCGLHVVSRDDGLTFHRIKAQSLEEEGTDLWAPLNWVIEERKEENEEHSLP